MNTMQVKYLTSNMTIVGLVNIFIQQNNNKKKGA
jgi:hypothetical protein